MNVSVTSVGGGLKNAVKGGGGGFILVNRDSLSASINLISNNRRIVDGGKFILIRICPCVMRTAHVDNGRHIFTVSGA
jgi:hypothetical protein